VTSYARAPTAVRLPGAPHGGRRVWPDTKSSARSASMWLGAVTVLCLGVAALGHVLACWAGWPSKVAAPGGAIAALLR
jgi:hypothetical protein